MNVDTRIIGGGKYRLTRNAHGSVTAMDIASGWAVSVPPALFNQSTTEILEEVERLLAVGTAPVRRDRPDMTDQEFRNAQFMGGIGDEEWD